jgi:hypothetical protein
MLRELAFTNFKTWDRAGLSFGKVTGLFGTNSPGKSSLIQFLLLLKQTKEATDRAISFDFNGPYVSLDVYKDVIHDHDERRRLAWNLVFEREKDLVLVDPSGKRTESLARGRQVKITGDVCAKDLAAATSGSTVHSSPTSLGIMCSRFTTSVSGLATHSGSTSPLITASNVLR